MSSSTPSESYPASCSPAIQGALSGLDARYQYVRSAHGTRSQKCNVQHLWLSERSDHVAQVALFGGAHLTYAFIVASPMARLYTEVLENRRSGVVRSKVAERGERLMSVLQPSDCCNVVTTLSLLKWWLCRLNLPVCIDLKNLRGDIEVTFASWHNIVSLVGGDEITSLSVNAELIPHLEELALSGAAFASLAPNFSSLSQLRVLHLRNFSIGQLNSLLHLPVVEELHVHGTMGRLDMSQFEFTKCIRELYVASNELLNVCGLSLCPRLEVLSIHSSSLKDMSGFTEAVGVTKLVIIGGAMTEIPVFRPTNVLECVSLPWCKKLTSLSNLVSCMYLRKIVACASGVATVAELGKCQLLETVDFSNCEELFDLSALSEAPQLRIVTASGSALRNIGGLGAWRVLSELDVSWCSGLEDLSSLSGAPRLRMVKAACSGVRNINDLNRCNLLEYVNFNYCDHLQSLSPLAGAAALKYVHAKGSGVRSVHSLELCQNLRVLEVSKCTNMPTLSPELAAFAT